MTEKRNENKKKDAIAASLLRRAGFVHVDVFLGSMGAWKGAGRPTVKPTS